MHGLGTLSRSYELFAWSDGEFPYIRGSVVKETAG